MTLADILQAPDAVKLPLLVLLADKGTGDNIQLVQFSAKFTNSSGQTVELRDELHFVNRTFHLDAIYQVECYLIGVYNAERFLENTLVNNVSSRKLERNTTTHRKTNRRDGILPGT
jgi:hypothetical protein